MIKPVRLVGLLRKLNGTPMFYVIGESKDGIPVEKYSPKEGKMESFARRCSSAQFYMINNVGKTPQVTQIGYFEDGRSRKSYKERDVLSEALVREEKSDSYKFANSL